MSETEDLKKLIKLKFLTAEIRKKKENVHVTRSEKPGHKLEKNFHFMAQWVS